MSIRQWRQPAMTALLLALACGSAWAQADALPAPAGAPAATAGPPAAEEGMTLMQLLAHGGPIMVLLGVFSLLALALIIYHFTVLRPGALCPHSLTANAVGLLRSGRREEARQLALSRGGLVAESLLAGLDAAEAGGRVSDAMQASGAKATAALWQRLNYLSDIAVLSPMLGILGTVLGMIQAFNAVVLSVGEVKPYALAGGVSKAMITTAGGLLVAIPAMGFYFFFRGRAQRIVAEAESQCSTLAEAVAGADAE